jgi:signal transduction histidine kinase
MPNLRHKILLLVLVIFRLSFLSGSSFAQNDKKEFKSPNDYIAAVKYYRYLNPDSAIFFVKRGLEMAKREHDQLSYAALLNQYGMIDDNAAKYKEARLKYLRAEQIYRQEKNEKGLASTLVRLGVVEKRKGNFDKALAYFFKALKLSEQNKDKLGMLEGRVVLAETYYGIGEYKNALENLSIAVKIDQQIPLSSFSFNMYISYAYVYIATKEYDQAIGYIQQGLSKIKKVEYNGSKVGLLTLLGKAYYQQGKISKATQSFLSALTLAREIKNIIREQGILVELSNIYTVSAPNKALMYLQEALAIADDHKMYSQQIIILNSMSSLYKKKGDFKTALALQEKSYQLSDEVYYKDMVKQITNLETAYELEKSNAQLTELKLKNTRDEMVKNVMLSIAIATSLLLMIMLAYYYRSRHFNKLLTKANHSLAESNVEKDKFFSIVAHDIRSPLVSTISILRLIGDKEIDEDTQSIMVEKLALHCESSLEILDKLLKWGQMQIKGVKLDIKEFNPLVNINRNVGLLKAAAEKKKISLLLDVPQNLNVTADSDHFDFVIRNLLANGVKFTPEGGYVKLSAEMAKDNMLSFAISDNGVGISNNRIHKLFELAATGTKGTSDEEGTSLGLVICKEFILANNGDFTVESEVGKGTSFIFTLPGSMSA